MRLIDADALKRAICLEQCGHMKETCDAECELIAYITNAPTIEAEPVKHGRWIDIPDKPEWDQKQCSLCGDIRCCQGKYCPNCGARMDREADDEE